MSAEKSWPEKALVAAAVLALIWTPITCMRAVDIEDSAIRLEKELKPDSSSSTYEHLVDIKNLLDAFRLSPYESHESP